MKYFKTKTGYCYLRNSQLVLVSGGLRSTGVKKSLIVSRCVVAAEFVCGVILLLSAYSCLDKQLWAGVAGFGLVGAWLFYGPLSYIICKYSAAPVIRKESIRGIRFCRGMKEITRSRFKITFADAKGRIRHRLVMLPEWGSDGSEMNEAVAIEMMNQYLLTN